MPSNRSDLLHVCNDQNTPLDDFKRMFCDRCIQPECTRSRAGSSKFEQRVANWHENLFVNPPRLDRDDPRFDKISGQKFLMIDPGRTPEVSTSSWVDPRDLSDANPDTTPKVKAIVAPTPVTPVPKVAAPAQPSPAPKPTTQQLIHLPTLNTPVQPPRMLGGAIPTPKADPWAGPDADPTSSTEKVVSPGTKIRLGGGNSGV